MKLLELLVNARIEWPADAEKVCQNYDRQIEIVKNDGDSYSTNIYVDNLSEKHRKYGDSVYECHAEVVTKDQYDNACKLVDDGYTLWFGGECPVNMNAHVEVVLCGDDLDGRDNFKRASDWRWEWEEGLTNIIAWRHYLKPENFGCRCDSVPVVTEYPAHSFLEKGVQHMKDRAAQRDSADGERSMAACVNAFNAMFGKDLTETQGWQFMVLLKMARSRNKFNPDDYEDGAAYTGLAGEAHSHE